MQDKSCKYSIKPTTKSKMNQDLEISLKKQLMQAKVDLKEEAQKQYKLDRKAD